MRIYLIFFALTFCRPIPDFVQDTELKSISIANGDIILDTRDLTNVSVGRCIGDNSGGCASVSRTKSTFYHINLAENALRFNTAVFSYESGNKVYTCHLGTVSLGALNLVWGEDEGKKDYCYEESESNPPVLNFAATCNDDNNYTSGGGEIAKEFKCGDKFSESMVTKGEKAAQDSLITPATKLSDIMVTAECVGNCLPENVKKVSCSACSKGNDFNEVFEFTTDAKNKTTKNFCGNIISQQVVSSSNLICCANCGDTNLEFSFRERLVKLVDGACVDLARMGFVECNSGDEIKITFELQKQ